MAQSKRVKDAKHRDNPIEDGPRMAQRHVSLTF